MGVLPASIQVQGLRPVHVNDKSVIVKVFYLQLSRMRVLISLQAVLSDRLSLKAVVHWAECCSLDSPVDRTVIVGLGTG